MQTTALAVLVVYPLHGSGLDLGLVTALQFVPMLLFGTWGGLMADRMNKRTHALLHPVGRHGHRLGPRGA